MNIDTFAMFPQAEDFMTDTIDVKNYIDEKLNLFFIGLNQIVKYSQEAGVSKNDEIAALDEAWFHLEEEDQLLFLIDFLNIKNSADFKKYYERYKKKKLGLLK